MSARSQRADHGLLRRVLQLPQARHPPVRTLRRARAPTAAPGGPAQADRRPGGSAHRHRVGDQARARDRTSEIGRSTDLLRFTAIVGAKIEAPGSMSLIGYVVSSVRGIKRYRLIPSATWL